MTKELNYTCQKPTGTGWAKVKKKCPSAYTRIVDSIHFMQPPNKWDLWNLRNKSFNHFDMH